MRYKIIAPNSMSGDGTYLNIKFQNYVAEADISETEKQWFTKYYFILHEVEKPIIKYKGKSDGNMDNIDS